MIKLYRATRPAYIRMFSTGNDPNRSLQRQQAKDRIDQQQREKIQQAPEMDAKDDVSFQDNYMYLKVVAWSTLFGVLAYQGHLVMKDRLQQRIARKEGRLEEYLEQKHKKQVNSLRGKIFGVHETPQE